MRRLFCLIALSGLMSACAPKAEFDQLAARVDALEKKVAEMETKAAAKPASNAAAAPVNTEAEQKAMDLYNEINKAVDAGDIDGAKATFAQLQSDSGSTRVTMSRAPRLKEEMDVIGTSVTSPTVEKWFQGSSKDLDFSSGTTVVVFWEVWCPHCQREVPEMEATYQKFKGKVDFVGLTKITKSATEEKVTEFLKEKGVTYPIAKETGDASKLFAVTGIPAAAVVKDGKVVWRGHPGRLTEDMINSWI